MVSPFDIQYPDLKIFVTQTTVDQNIFTVLGEAQDVMRRAGVPADEVDELRSKVLFADDYESAVRAIRQTVSVIIVP